ncbi:MAG: hypothetical protein GY868_14650, partial [Deltaproteobacteria bacterium]|nr:hypothetical protein [Deltaproteobacteria bacterium]
TVITTGEVEELSVELSLGSGLDLDFGERVTFSLVGIGLSAAQMPFFYESGESPFSVAVNIPVGEGTALVPLTVFISGLYGTFEPVIPFEIKFSTEAPAEEADDDHDEDHEDDDHDDDDHEDEDDHEEDDDDHDH